MCEGSGNIPGELGYFCSTQCKLQALENLKILYFRNRLGDTKKQDTQKPSRNSQGYFSML